MSFSYAGEPLAYELTDALRSSVYDQLMWLGHCFDERAWRENGAWLRIKFSVSVRSCLRAQAKEGLMRCDNAF